MIQMLPKIQILPMIQTKLIDEFKSFLFVQKQRSDHTIANYIADINQFFNMTNVGYDHVNETIVSTYLHQLNQKNLSNQTIYRKLVSLDQFWRFLIQNDFWDS